MIATPAIVHAAHTVHAAFVARQHIGGDQWDEAVTTLAAARYQLGGTPRRLIARLFLLCRSEEPADLAGASAALVDYLDTHLAAPPPPGLPESPPPDDPDGQLRMFEL